MASKSEQVRNMETLMGETVPVHDAMLQARLAFRIAHAYQRRLLDLLGAFGARLREIDAKLAFQYWSPWSSSMPPRSTTNPFEGKWAWDFLPLARTDFFWASADRARARAIGVGVFHRIDSAFGATRPGEPDALQFAPAQSSRTELNVYVMAVGQTWQMEFDWDGLYGAVNEGFPEIWEAGTPKPLDLGGRKLVVGGFVVNAAMLPDSEAANAHLFQPTIAFAKAAAEAASRL